MIITSGNDEHGGAAAGHVNRNDSGDPLSRIANDITKCEFLISYAASIGTHNIGSDIRAVKKARAAVAKGAVNPDTERDFYVAMTRVVDRVPYPNVETASDLKLCCELISYAVQAGKPVHKNDLKAVSEARIAQRNLTWQVETEVGFYDALSHISHSVAPVVAKTAGSEAKKGARRAIRNYTIAAGILTFFVLILSCLLFIVKQISEDISNVVVKNDPAAVMLHNQLQAYSAAIVTADRTATQEALVLTQNSPAALEIKEGLQQFATGNRQLFADVNRTKAISQFVFRFPNWLGHHIFGIQNWGDDWGGVVNQYSPECQGPKGYKVTTPSELYSLFGPGYALGTVQTISAPSPNDWQCDADSIRHALEVDLPMFGMGQTADKTRQIIPQDAVNQGFQKIAVYQDIRAMATYARDIILAFVGSTTGFLLPILYAWLGACASILRRLRADSTASVFHPEYSKVANRAHVTTAVIVGISIGLFSNLVRGGTEVSPLAVAFVAGYASDTFFEFIDRLVAAMFPSDGPRDQLGTDRNRGSISKRPLFNRSVLHRKVTGIARKNRARTL